MLVSFFRYDERTIVGVGTAPSGPWHPHVPGHPDFVTKHLRAITKATSCPGAGSHLLGSARQSWQQQCDPLALRRVRVFRPTVVVARSRRRTQTRQWKNQGLLLGIETRGQWSKQPHVLLDLQGTKGPKFHAKSRVHLGMLKELSCVTQPLLRLPTCCGRMRRFDVLAD